MTSSLSIAAAAAPPSQVNSAANSEAIAQADGHLLNVKRGGARRGELDGQGYAVEPPADRGDRREFLGAR
jgi:hypothetical protein